MSKVLMRIIQLILAIAIAVLAYVLYHSIKDPYKAIERDQELTELTRGRMDQLRAGLTRYWEINERFPHSLDSVVTFIKTDSLLAARPDSFFVGIPFQADSLTFLPRDPTRSYEYVVNDTTRVSIYYLKDPDSEDLIGSMTPDITMVHAASWE